MLVTAAARFRKDPTSWTQQQGKADAISGRTITRQNLKRDYSIRSELRCRSALPFQVSPSQPTQSRRGRLRYGQFVLATRYWSDGWKRFQRRPDHTPASKLLVPPLTGGLLSNISPRLLRVSLPKESTKVLIAIPEAQSATNHEKDLVQKTLESPGRRRFGSCVCY